MLYAQRSLYIGYRNGYESTPDDSIANNLANVNQTAYKSDQAIYKSFPEMLIQRTSEDGLGWDPPG